MTDSDQEDSCRDVGDFRLMSRRSIDSLAPCGSFMVFARDGRLGWVSTDLCVMNAKRAPQEKRNIRYVR
jgi:hypothetical protein